MAVVYIVRVMVRASKVVMKELRVLERLLKVLKVSVETSWLPSGENFYAGRLSRQWDARDIQVMRCVLRSLKDSYHLGEGGAVFPYRPLEVAPVAQRKVAVADLKEKWDDGEARLYNPPPDMMSATLGKMCREGGRGLVLAPAWMGATWMAELKRMADRPHVMKEPVRSLFAGRRKMNAKWELMVAEVGLEGLRPSRKEVRFKGGEKLG